MFPRLARYSRFGALVLVPVLATPRPAADGWLLTWSTTSTTTGDATEFMKPPFDDNAFDITAGYTVTDMRSAMAEMRKSPSDAEANCGKENGVGNCEQGEVKTDSARKAARDSTEGAKARAIKDGKNDTGGGLLSKVGGLFRRRTPAKTPPKDAPRKDSTKTDTTRKKPPP